MMMGYKKVEAAESHLELRFNVRLVSHGRFSVFLLSSSNFTKPRTRQMGLTNCT
jgi:hypothetical protein